MPTAGVTAGSTMPREAHRPYRFGMTLLCFGGLLNWVGLFENYTEPVRYIGVTCVVSGAILLCFAICCWLRPGAHRENSWGQSHQHANPTTAGRGSVHFITLERSSSGATVQPAQGAQKPPDYESVTDKPPSYDDAIKLSPALLWLANEHERHGGELMEGAPGGAGSAKVEGGGDEEPIVREVDGAGRASRMCPSPTSCPPPPTTHEADVAPGSPSEPPPPCEQADQADGAATEASISTSTLPGTIKYSQRTASDGQDSRDGPSIM